MIFMMATTLVAMGAKLADFTRAWRHDGDTGNFLLMLMGGVIMALSVWLAVEAVLRFIQYRRGTLASPAGTGQGPASSQ